jgi:choline dehydrogenase-like flavoprotein
LNNRQIAQPRGRTLGGSSAINIAMVIYPSKLGVDAWEKLGNRGWNWETLQPYFHKFQHLIEPSAATSTQLSLDYLNKELYDSNGPVQVSFGEGIASPFKAAWPKTFEELGHRLTADPLSGVSTGAFIHPGSIDSTGARSHAGSAYYNKDVAERANLKVITETSVEKVILEEMSDGKFRATGVQIIAKDGSPCTISAREEVIVSAGALKSPQLLELSGIGNKEILESHGISVLINNPFVGENLQDHGFVPCSWEVENPLSSGDCQRDLEIAKLLVDEYQNSGSGPLSACQTASSFMPLVDMSAQERRDLVEEHLTADLPCNPPFLKVQYETIRDMLLDNDEPSGQYTMAPFQINPAAGPSLQGVFGMKVPGNYMTIMSVLNYPFSRGSVHISSQSSTDPPKIDPRYLSHPLDRELNARHVMWLKKLSETEPLASLLKLNGRRIHGERLATLEGARELVKDSFLSNYHLTSTCSMMPQDLGGVVDEHLKVYGTENLRVVDASIFPLIPRGNIQSSVYAVSERAADIIRAERSTRIARKKLECGLALATELTRQRQKKTPLSMEHLLN